jgi:RNA polymerase sigma-70 factor (ECF subfamily)
MKVTGLIQQITFQEPALEREDDAAACDDAFSALVERQSRFVFRVAYSVLRNTHDSEDVVQETFLKLYRSRKWRNVDNERAFLARAAWRVAVDRLSRVRMETPDSGLPSRGENPEQAAIAADWNAAIHRLIDALPEELRQPLALSSVEELKSHEIGEIMGVPEGTVRSRLSRARQILKLKLNAMMAGAHGR